jgi:putative NIF3 family GTP cyclohydrolase 1 type 2
MRSKVCCAALVILVSTVWPVIGADTKATQPPTAREVVERIKKSVGVPWSDRTVDTFKAGDPDTPVTGIATTFLATYDVLQRAAASGKNLIITHEPTFYEHQERTERLGDDPVLAAKRELIEKHKLVVWRFHDHWHKRNPDGIILGMTERMGLTPFRVDSAPSGGKEGLREGPFYRLPETTVGQLAAAMKDKLKANVVRVVGNPDMKVTRVGFACGAPGSWAQIRMLQSDEVEVLLAGESPEWETTEYVRDAVAAGKRKAVIFLGHCNSEEAGMEYCARWLKTVVPEVPVEFISAGDPFWSPR